MNAVAMVGLVEITLPDHTIRWCDGGFFEWEGETFRSRDPVFGTLGAVQAMSEGVGDSVPALALTILPPDTSAAADLAQPGHQTSRVRFILGEYSVATGTITSAEVQFDGQVDQSILTVGKGKRELAMSVVSLAERLFEGNIGNTLNPTWHKSVWPGETGHDNATGLSTQVAWGVESPNGYGSQTAAGRYGDFVQAVANQRRR